MQPIGAAADLVAGDEFDDGVAVVKLLVAFDLQAEPFGLGVGVEVEGGRAGGRVPGGEEVGFELEDVGAVARAHQGFGGGGGGAGSVAAAAIFVAVRQAAGAGGGRHFSKASHRRGRGGIRYGSQPVLPVHR